MTDKLHDTRFTMLDSGDFLPFHSADYRVILRMHPDIQVNIRSLVSECQWPIKETDS